MRGFILRVAIFALPLLVFALEALAQGRRP